MSKLTVAIVCAAASVAAHAQTTAPEEPGCDFTPLLDTSGWGRVDVMADLFRSGCEDELYSDPPDNLPAYFGEEAVSEMVDVAQTLAETYRWEDDWVRIGGVFEYIAAGHYHVQSEAVGAWSAELYDAIEKLVTTFSEVEDFLYPSMPQGWAVRSLFRAADNPATRLQALSRLRQLVVNWRPGLANDRSYVQAMYAATELMRNAHADENLVETVEALGDLPEAMANMVLDATDWIVATTGYSLMIGRVAEELARLLAYPEASFAAAVERSVQRILDHPQILPIFDPTLVRSEVDPNTAQWTDGRPMRGYMIYASVADVIEQSGRCDDFYGVYGDGQNTPCDDRTLVAGELFPADGSLRECRSDGASLNVNVSAQANGVFWQPHTFTERCGGIDLVFYWVELDRAPDYGGNGCGLRSPALGGGAVPECTNWVRFFPDNPERNYHVTSRAEFDRLTERSRETKLDQFCDVASEAKDDFRDVFGDDLSSVAADNNTDLEIVLFEDGYEYASYVEWLFDGDETAPGSFVESDPSEAADAEGRTPSRVLTHPAGSNYAVVWVAEDECFWGGQTEVLDPAADAVELKREAARHYDSRYNLHGRPDMAENGLVWWDDGLAQHVKVGGRVHDDARELAMREEPRALSDILMATYADRIDREHYWWAQLVVLYLTTEQPDSVEFILDSTRAGEYEQAMRYVGLMGAAFDDGWATWLADVVSQGLESTESAIDGEVDENNLAEGWDGTGDDGGGTGGGGTDG